MDITGIVAILCVFGVAPAIVWLRSQHRLKERQLELAAEGKLALGPAPVDAKLLEENRKLRERVENLESIVCSVDFELNQKIAKLIAEPGSVVPALPPQSPAAEPASSDSDSAHGAHGAHGALSKTATAMAPPQGSAVGPTAASLHVGAVLANRYRIVRLIGQGGMGAVYLAEDEVLVDQVALKVIAANSVTFSTSDRAALAARFRREAAAARKVSAPNVVRIHDIGEAPGNLLYISMEYVKGHTLADVMQQRGLLPIATAIDYLKQVAAGLAAAHSAGVIHRDLKPGNVIVTEQGVVKLIDFGLATMAKGGQGESLTMTGALLGTPNYMAPEQVRGRAVDARTDIYALGAMAFHVLTGRPPFAGDNAIAVGFAHCNDDAPSVASLRPETPPAAVAAIAKALAKAPADRFADPLEFVTGW